MTTIAVWVGPGLPGQPVFVERHFTELACLGHFIDARYAQSSDETLPLLGEVEYLLGSWGFPCMNAELLAQLPRLRAIFYAAGSVKGFVTPAMYARGIAVSSAAPVNAIPVAEYTLGVLLLANKRFWQVMRQGVAAIPPRDQIPGNYQRTVGIIGASMVGRAVLRLLRSYNFTVLLSDPMIDAEEAANLGAVKVSLPELMERSDVVSLHAPNLPSLRGMINAEMLARMPDGATFINTARGALVDETALLAELQWGRLYAVLDVTDPEPPVPGSPFYTLPNVIYTPHIAGCLGNECESMADFAIAELKRYLQREPLLNQVLEASLATLA